MISAWKASICICICIAIVLGACGKKPAEPPAVGSGSAADPEAAAPAPPPPAPAPVEEVSCDVAAKEYAKKMAAAPGNVLSDAKPDDGLIYYTAISMEDYCVGEDGCCVPWTAAERACVKAATPATVAACFTGAALSQVNAGLTEVVTTALANQQRNAEAKAAGSAAPE
jgi:hypothetical protein